MNEIRKQLLDLMLKIRKAEEKIVEVYTKEQAMRTPTHLSIGQEAVAAGLACALRQDDQIFAGHRCHAAYLAKGGQYDAFFAELCGRASGIAEGRAGSAHLAEPTVHVYSSPILGAMIPVAVGAALSFQMDGKDSIAVAVFGDAAVEEGIFAESVNFAVTKRLPVLFVCENNLYSTHSPLSVRQPASPIHERVKFPEMPALPIDGNDAGIVYRTMCEAVVKLRRGSGPMFIECLTYRVREHVGPLLDHDRGYRTKQEVDAWMGRCPVARWKKYLLEQKVLSAVDIEQMENAWARAADEAYARALKSPWPSPDTLLDNVYGSTRPAFGGACSPQVDRNTRPLTYAQAISEALVQGMQADGNVFIFGLGVDDCKGIFGTTREAFTRFGPSRVFDAPASESALTGISIGSALNKKRPVLVHARNDFMFLTLDQMINNAAKWKYTYAGRSSVPFLVRGMIGKGWGQGPTHSQSLQAVLAHFPGLIVAMPSNACDVKGIILQALKTDGPVIVLEHRVLYDTSCDVPAGAYSLPFGKARIARPGQDVTVVAASLMVSEALKAAAEVAQAGIDVEVIDPVTIQPLDENVLLQSVRKTGRLIVADNGWLRCGFSAEVAAVVAEKAFHDLKAPVKRIGWPECPCPVSKVLEDAFYPMAEDIARAAWRLMGKKEKYAAQKKAADTFVGPY